MGRPILSGLIGIGRATPVGLRIIRDNVLLMKNLGLNPVIFDHPDLICGISKRPQNMSFVHGNTEDSLSNRRIFLHSLNINYESLVCANQVHGSRISCVSSDNKGRGAKTTDTAFVDTDGLITNIRNLPLAVFTADCLSIFIYDPVHHSIGLVHAGWRGSKDQIGPKTIQLMRRYFNSKPEDLLAGFGPCLNKCCYEVGKEFKGYFSYGVSKENGRYYLDLPEINKRQLVDIGLKEKNISSLCPCTSCDNKGYFSFRREGKDVGRTMSVVMLK